eukprot:748841-Hanusia_phi.AAC.2
MQFSIAAISPVITMSPAPIVLPIKPTSQAVFNPTLDFQIRKYVTGKSYNVRRRNSSFLTFSPEHRKSADSQETPAQLSPSQGSAVFPAPSRKITVGEPFAVRLVPRKRKQPENCAEGINQREEVKISKEDVEKYFDMPQPEAAIALGISLSTLKNVCRKIGVYRWPYQRQYGANKLKTSKAWLEYEAWMEEALEHVEEKQRFCDFGVPRSRLAVME